MADIVFAVVELEKHKHQHEEQEQQQEQQRHQQHQQLPQQQHQLPQQQQQPTQLRGLSAAIPMESQLHRVPQEYQLQHQYQHDQQQQQQQPQNGYLLVDPSQVAQTPPQNYEAASQHQQYQQPQPQQQQIHYHPQQQQQQTTTQTQQQLVPPQELLLSFQNLNPIPASVFSYTMFLSSSLALWVLYLVLPRGVRKQYFRANRKRHARRLDHHMPAAGYWMPVQSMKAQAGSTVSASTVSMSHPHANLNVVHHRQNHNNAHHNNGTQPYSSSVIAAAAARNKKRTPTANDGGNININANANTHSPSSSPNHRAGRTLITPKHPPSPKHPALKKIAPNKILAETMARLQGRGIRLVAHGVHCDPKRVWIRLLQEETTDTASNNTNDRGGVGVGEPSVTWQTEFPRRVPDQNGHVSIVLMRGSLHSIGLQHILYIDVGKKTHALQLTKGVPDTMCLSLLTQNGSLDLQANSKLERDSLVSCFSMILDDIHEEDWRGLYEATPEPSLANSHSVAGSSSFVNGIGNGNVNVNVNGILHMNRRPSYNLDSSLTPGGISTGTNNFQTPNSLFTPTASANTSANTNTNTMASANSKKAFSEEKNRMLQLL